MSATQMSCECCVCSARAKLTRQVERFPKTLIYLTCPFGKEPMGNILEGATLTLTWCLTKLFPKPVGSREKALVSVIAPYFNK